MRDYVYYTRSVIRAASASTGVQVRTLAALTALLSGSLQLARKQLIYESAENNPFARLRSLVREEPAVSDSFCCLRTKPVDSRPLVESMTP
jgi:hypothetical protein